MGYGHRLLLLRDLFGHYFGAGDPPASDPGVTVSIADSDVIVKILQWVGSLLSRKQHAIMYYFIYLNK